MESFRGQKGIPLNLFPFFGELWLIKENHRTFDSVSFDFSATEEIVYE
jgi:hypothetical protein